MVFGRLGRIVTGSAVPGHGFGWRMDRGQKTPETILLQQAIRRQWPTTAIDFEN